MDKILKVIGTLAPALAKSLIPGGPLVSAGIDMLGQALGIVAPDEDKLLAKVKNLTPEDVAAIKKAEFDFKARMKELDIKDEEIHAGDRDSARKRQMALDDWAPGVIAIVVFIGFFGTLAAMIWVDSPETSRQPVNILLGTLGAAVIAIVQYYFGSSSSSAKKNELLVSK